MLLPGLTGLGHADEVYDLWRYADELSGASRFADDAVRHVDELVDGSKLLDNTDDAGRFVDDVEKNLDCLINSFSADTPVMTDQGEVPISQVAVGDRVLAYNEATGETGYYTVTAVIAHIDPSLLELTIDGEILETRARCPRGALRASLDDPSSCSAGVAR